MIILSPILANAHRLESFTELPTLIFQRFAMQHLQFPQLRALDLDCSAEYPDEVLKGYTWMVDAPLLRELELSALMDGSDGILPGDFLDFQSGPPYMKIPWSQLTHFSSSSMTLAVTASRRLVYFNSKPRDFHSPRARILQSIRVLENPTT
jgi:hypothetical protein